MPAEEPDDAALAAVARELYTRVPAEFVAARNARAAQLRREGQRALATAVRTLPRASAPAWAVGAVARAVPEELDALGSLGAELRVAQASANPAELRELSRRRRTMTTRVGQVAARLAQEQGVDLSQAAVEQVETTLQALVVDPDAERAVRSCLLVRPLEPGGDVASALALPGVVRDAAEASDGDDESDDDVDADSADDADEPDDDESPPPRPRRSSVRLLRGPQEDDDAPTPRRSTEDGPPARQREQRPSAVDLARAVRRAERELRARQRTAEQALTDLEDAQEELSRVEARVLQVAARVEELRRELADREEELSDLDEERSAAAEEREDAEERARVAARELDEARARLAELAE